MDRPGQQYGPGILFTAAAVCLMHACGGGAAQTEPPKPQSAEGGAFPAAAEDPVDFIRKLVVDPSHVEGRVDWDFNDRFYKASGVSYGDGEEPPVREDRLATLVGMLEELPRDCDHMYSTDEGFTAVVFPPAMDSHSDEEAAEIDTVIEELQKGIEVMAYCVRAEEFEDCEPGTEDETVPDCVVEDMVHEEIFFSINVLAGPDGKWKIRAWRDMTTESGLAH